MDRTWSIDPSYQFKTLCQGDAEFVASLYQNESIMQFIGPTLNAEQVQVMFQQMISEVEQQSAMYCVLMYRGKKIGLVSNLWNQATQVIESGMLLLPSQQNSGVCKWAQPESMRMAMQLFPAQQCHIYIDTDNIAANKSIASLGFVQVANQSALKKHQNLNLWVFDLSSL